MSKLVYDPNNPMPDDELDKLAKEDFDKFLEYLDSKTEYLKSKSSLIAKHDISRNQDINDFWKNSIKLVKNFSYDKDEMMQMLKIQIKQNLRHTINNNKIKIENVLKND